MNQDTDTDTDTDMDNRKGRNTAKRMNEQRNEQGKQMNKPVGHFLAWALDVENAAQKKKQVMQEGAVLVASEGGATRLAVTPLAVFTAVSTRARVWVWRKHRAVVVGRVRSVAAPHHVGEKRIASHGREQLFVGIDDGRQALDHCRAINTSSSNSNSNSNSNQKPSKQA